MNGGVAIGRVGVCVLSRGMVCLPKTVPGAEESAFLSAIPSTLYQNTPLCAVPKAHVILATFVSQCSRKQAPPYGWNPG